MDSEGGQCKVSSLEVDRRCGCRHAGASSLGLGSVRAGGVREAFGPVAAVQGVAAHLLSQEHLGPREEQSLAGGCTPAPLSSA